MKRLAALAFAAALSAPAAAQDAKVSMPILVPITGFLSLEGASQRNGALLAMRRAPKGVSPFAEVSDTASRRTSR
jgi:branched-chain amino acid transport system substrate-binding protein